MSKETKKKGTKKPYQKPEIVYEDFSLTTNIAAGCEVRTDTPAAEQCGVDMGDDFVVFLDSMQGICNTYRPDDEFGYCYHVPTPDNNLFNS